jgi:hypothetical protein
MEYLFEMQMKSDSSFWGVIVHSTNKIKALRAARRQMSRRGYSTRNAVVIYVCCTEELYGISTEELKRRTIGSHSGMIES